MMYFFNVTDILFAETRFSSRDLSPVHRIETPKANSNGEENYPKVHQEVGKKI